MNRRTLLIRIGAVTAAAAFAGCLDDSATGAPGGDGGDDDTEYEDGDEGGGVGEDDGERGSDEEGTEDDEGEENEPSIADRRIETIDSASADEILSVDSETTVSFEEDSVEIDGRLEAPTPCYDAVFADVSLEGGHLTVVVELEEDVEQEACIQVISEIDYEATITFESDVPETVTVIHVDEQGRETAAEWTA